MRYMLLIGSEDRNQVQAPSPKAQMDAIVQAHARFAEELRAKGKMVAADRLRPDSDASRVRLKAGQRQVMDGPFGISSTPRRCATTTSCPPPAPTSSADSGAGRRRRARYRRALDRADNAREQSFLAARLRACEQACGTSQIP